MRSASQRDPSRVMAERPGGRIKGFFTLAKIFFSPIDGRSWDLLRETIPRIFPSVRQLSTGELAAWLADENREKPLLIDARNQAEFAISHLQNAVCVRAPD